MAPQALHLYLLLEDRRSVVESHRRLLLRLQQRLKTVSVTA
jgi:hypothetical protein